VLTAIMIAGWEPLRGRRLREIEVVGSTQPTRNHLSGAPRQSVNSSTHTPGNIL
jgi:hypothetical protein